MPTTISSDLHRLNVAGPVYDLATTVGKFLALGLQLEDAIGRVTSAPAAAIGMDGIVGTLAEGACGDAVIFDVRGGRFELHDADGDTRTGTERLVPMAVVRAGAIRPVGPDRVEAISSRSELDPERDRRVGSGIGGIETPRLSND
jgi:dihydroorotase